MVPRQNQTPSINAIEIQEDETRYKVQTNQVILFHSTHNTIIHSPSLHRDKKLIKDRLKRSVYGVKMGQRHSIQFDDRGQPVGDNSAIWPSFHGTLVRLDNISPIVTSVWRRIGETAEHRA